METEQLLMYVGMGVIILFAIYFVLKMGSLQTRVIEGLTSNSKTQKNVMDSMAEGDIKALKSAIEKYSDNLLISKYKSDYEDMLIDFEQVIDYSLLTNLIVVSSMLGPEGLNIGKGGITLHQLQILNELYTLKTNLNSTMDFLDGQKTSGGLFGGSKTSSSSSKSKSFF